MATAWLAGGSGLVGGALLRLLLDDPDFGKVVSVGRRALPVEHPKLAQVVADFSSPAPLEALDPPAVGFCCLGTTIGKAGSPEAFRRVDHGAVLAFARAARAKGARVFVHVSSLGANPRSRVFYGAVKGEIERDVAGLGIPSVYALRPSVLDGAREERRPGERLALVVGRALGPLLGRYRPTPIEAVARAMVASAKAAAPGAHVVEADAILRA
jgi:uncharacterized protein YbjT (DUF2867 family)